MEKLKLSVVILIMALANLANAQLPSIPKNPGPVGCYSTTWAIYVNQPWENLVEVGYGAFIEFKTNEVCNASSYVWTREDGITFTTNGPSLSLSSDELIPEQPCSTYESKISGGAYMTNFSVTTGISNSVTIPVAIHGAPGCSQTDVPKRPNLEDGVPGSF